MLSTLLFSQVSTGGQLLLYGLIFFGMIGFLFWLLVLVYYVYAFFFYVIFGFFKLIYDTVKF